MLTEANRGVPMAMTLAFIRPSGMAEPSVGPDSMVSTEMVAKWGHEITLASPSVQSVFVTAFLLVTMGLKSH